ncbi:MAG TPA: methyltransferase domain-containing protein [Kofleriaceae bacterium]
MASRLVPKRLLDRRVTSRVRVLLDEWLPPVVREWRPLNRMLVRLMHGPTFDLDFKERAFHLSDREIAEAYDRLAQGGSRFRDTDTTPAQIDAIVAAARGRVLEVGAGNGAIAERLRPAHDVVAVDVTLGSAQETRRRANCPVALAGLPDLPFADDAFDTVVCSHTLEHIPDLWRAAAELRRVAKRVIVVVPCQRYYRYTVDYHLHFFPSAGPLERLLAGNAQLIDGDWFVVADR